MSGVYDDAVLKLWVPGTPRPQGSMALMRSKDGSREVAKYPTSTVAHRNSVVTHLSSHWDGGDPIARPIKLLCVFEFPRPKGHWGTGRNADRLKGSAPAIHAQTPDLDKLLRLVNDALTIARVIEDDALVTAMVGRKVWAAGKVAEGRTGIVVKGADA